MHEGKTWRERKTFKIKIFMEHTELVQGNLKKETENLDYLVITYKVFFVI